jgi:hypothetical protein
LAAVIERDIGFDVGMLNITTPDMYIIRLTTLDKGQFLFIFHSRCPVVRDRSRQATRSGSAGIIPARQYA